MVLLNLSPAFCTVNHGILCEWAAGCCSGRAPSCLAEYCLTPLVPEKNGVPQGLALFNANLNPLPGEIIRELGLCCCH